MSDADASLRIVFAGSPEFAVPALDALLGGRHQLLAAYCQPDRPAGRGRRLTACPVKRRAQAAGVPVRQPERLRGSEACGSLAALQPDLLVVVAYGQILARTVLETPRLGCINLHPSLLPRWRGAAPIQRAMLAGDRETGVCVMRLEEGLDSGPVYACQALAIESGMTAGELQERLACRGAALLGQTVDALAAGSATARPQSTEGITYAAKIDKREAEIDWSRPAVEIERQVLAFNPWPVAYSRWGERILRIWRARAAAGGGPPGQVLAQSAAGIDVGCGHGLLRISELQLPGGRRLDAAAFLNGHSLAAAQLG